MFDRYTPQINTSCLDYYQTALEEKLPYSRQVLWGLIGDLSGAESIFALWFIFIGYLRVLNCQ